MATQTPQPVCSFNKYGHCKFQKKCRKMHVEEICESLECEQRKCSLRHPKLCSFYRDYKFCKFAEYCSFSHNIHNNHSNEALEKEISDIKKNLDLLRERENENENKIQILDSEINEREVLIKNIYSKFEESIEKIDMLEKKVKMVEDKNNYLQSKIEMFEKRNHTSTENFVCNICDLILKTKLEMTEHKKEAHRNKENDIETVSEIVTESESSNLPKADEKIFQCYKCNFKSSSDHGLKIHNAKKHSASNNFNSPFVHSPRGPFPAQFPPRYPPRFPHSPMW
jgi:hypothetical protein